MADIFISYSREDQNYVQELTAYLKSKGLSVWVDERIDHGDRWWQTIIANIRKCAAMVVVMTPESEKTEWVEREYFFADRIKKPLFPLLLKGDCFPFFVNQQYSDVKDRSMPTKALIETLRQLVEQANEERKRKEEAQKRIEAARKAEEERKQKEAEADAKATIESVSSEPRKSGKDLKFGAAGVVIALLIAGIWWWFSHREGRLFVKAVPENSIVKILNIDKPFQQGIELEPGKYHVQVSLEDYEPQERSIELGPGEEKQINFELAPKKFIANSIGMKFALIPTGKFVMGSPNNEPERDNDEKQHEVKISKPFFLQTTEVSQGQWGKVMGNNPSSFKGCGDDCPVENISWDDAQKFIGKLNQMEGTNKYRLPTEAEWEYACRAGTQTAFFTGECISTDQANYDGNYPGDNCPKGKFRQKTVKVGSFQSNAWGLKDMHGNVWEWCQDWYGDYPPNAVIDPIGPNNGKYRVLRGGSWESKARNFRSANRFRSEPGWRDYYIGFRVARDF